MEKGSKEESSVRRNVIDAFSNLLERLDKIYSGSEAPDEFIDRINFWNTACGLPDAIAKELHTLRKWSNVSRHYSTEPGRWKREGPRGDKAAELIESLDAQVSDLEARVAGT